MKMFNPITPQCARVYQVLSQSRGRWMTNEEVAELSKVCGRTTRDHLIKLIDQGLAECAFMVRPRLFRIKEAEDQDSRDHRGQIQRAIEIYNIP